THVSDIFILKMFIERRKSITESEESSDDEVVNFRRKVINRISSNSDSDIEPYASEDLDDMLEELAIDEEEEQNSVDDSFTISIGTNSLTGNSHFRSPEKVGF
ncbi:unnamed protein product, partial [Heterotrigona itama]